MVKNRFLKLNTFLKNNPLAAGMLLFLICLAFFGYLQLSPALADPDSFYHVKIASLMAEGQLIQQLPQLQFTILRDGFVDHHFLYHLCLIPFVKFLPPVVGGKLAQILFASLVILAFFCLLKKLKVQAAWWYSLFLLFCSPFVFRLSLVKGQSLSLIILMVAIYLIIKKKHWLLIPLSFIYVWAYGGWILILVFAILYAIADTIYEAINRFSAEKFDLKKIFNIQYLIFNIYNFFSLGHIKLILSVITGLALGLIANPYFPKNLYFYYVQVFAIGIVNQRDKIGVGSEWYPFDVGNFFQATGLPLLLAAFAIVLFFGYLKKMPREAYFLFGVAALFVAATGKSQRYIEYLVPFTVLFAAYIYSEAWRAEKIRSDLRIVMKIMHKYLWTEKVSRVFIGACLIMAAATLFIQASLSNRQLLSHLGYDYLGQASRYIRDNSTAGDIVFHSDWDIFPELYYHNDKNYYIVGLDATFMYMFDQDLYNKWCDITWGRRYDQAYQIIKNDFRAKFVLVAKKNKDMLNLIENNFYFVKVYEDQEAAVYRVN